MRWLIFKINLWSKFDAALAVVQENFRVPCPQSWDDCAVAWCRQVKRNNDVVYAGEPPECFTLTSETMHLGFSPSSLSLCRFREGSGCTMVEGLVVGLPDVALWDELADKLLAAGWVADEVSK